MFQSTFTVSDTLTESTSTICSQASNVDTKKYQY